MISSKKFQPSPSERSKLDSIQGISSKMNALFNLIDVRSAEIQVILQNIPIKIIFGNKF
jgi:hypothetical protein